MQLARPLASHLVTAEAGVVLHEPDVLRLALEVRVDPVPLRAGAGELALGRDSDQREPVPGRVVLRRGAWIRRGDRLQAQRRPGLRPLLRRVDQPVPTHPDVVARLRQVGEEVAPVVVGHHDLGELRREVRGLGDHPHPRLGAARTRHHSRDVVAIDRRLSGDELRAARAARPEQRGGRHRHNREECLRRLHLPTPLMMFHRGPRLIDRGEMSGVRRTCAPTRS